MPENGRLTTRQLARIKHPSLELFLACDAASASWNTMRLYLLQRYGRRGDITAEGPLGAYRNFDGQVKCKALFGSNAATPGRSNHGWGHAVDVANHDMADLIDRHGAPFGWHHWDAKWEWWHREYDGGFNRPDPGPDERNPVLRKGSGGPGQAIPVRKLQRMLNRRANAGLDEDGDFGDLTRKALAAFQRAAGVTANGICDASVWALLAATPELPASKRMPAAKTKPRPKPKEQAAAPTTPLRGFDVSDARGDIDFAKAKKAGMSFVSVRVADGDIHDVRYGPGRIKALRESGLAWFPYYYARVASDHNNQRDGAAEADMVLRMARAAGWGRKGDLPLAYDFENANGQSSRKCAGHLVDFIRAYRSRRGHVPILYTMPGFFNAICKELGAAERKLVARCPLWIAHWEVRDPGSLAPWGDAWSLWQDSDHGAVPGVSSRCDTDCFRGTEEDFANLIVSSV
jgi:GH25 family lysozyme M1 (1,4-beta-N-acetylmuramidase)